MGRVDGKTAIVTGGALGIGRDTCLLLASEGAKVAVTDILDEAGQEVVREAQSRGGTARFWHLDVTDEATVGRVFADVSKTYASVDVLVNNAGITGQDKPTDRLTLEDWRRVMAVNVEGVFLCTRAAVPLMRERRAGSIINLSSIYGIVGAPDIPAYHASKGAVRLMTKTDALLYARDGIRVNSVHPGFIWTPLVEDLGRRSPEGPVAYREHLDSLHPLGHLGSPEDVAYGILYLASDEAKFVTGSELVIDGGYTAR
jgi:NAD(P)-dependent dehydrogenase (short-subunit alcohol dehydrogenase family)